MKNSPWNYALAITCIAAIGLSSIAWTGNQQNKSYQSQQDTVPKKQKSAAPSKTFKKDFDKTHGQNGRGFLVFIIGPD